MISPTDHVRNTIISKILSCGEISNLSINLLAAPTRIYIFAPVSQALGISPILEMTVWSSDCFVQLHSLMMGQ